MASSQDLHSPFSLLPPRLPRRQSSGRPLPLFTQPSEESAVVTEDPRSAPLPLEEPPRKRGLFAGRKSFSSLRGHHFSDLKNQLQTARANVKSVLQHAGRDRSSPTTDNDPWQDSRSRRQPVRRRRSTTLLLSRPWTSHPFADSSKPSEPTRPETVRSKEPSFLHMDPSQGAAARQFARDYGKFPASGLSPGATSSSGDHFWVHHHRDRESGVSLSMDMNAMDLGDDSEGDDSSNALIDPFDYLPRELSTYVMSFLDITDVLQAQRVSRHWQELAKDPVLRREMFLSRWSNAKHANVLPAPVGGQGLGRAREVQQDWARMYQARKELAERWRKGPIASRARAIYLNGHQDSVYCVQFDERYVITGSRDRTIRIWDIRDGTLLRVIGIPEAIDHDHSASSIVGTHQPLVGPMHVVNRTPRLNESGIYHVPDFYHNASILCLQYDSEILVSGSSDCTLIVWDVRTWQPIRRLCEHRAGVLDIAFDDVKIVSCSKDGTICVWDRGNGALLTKLTGHRGPVNAVQLRGDRVVSASGEGCAKLWELSISDAGTSAARCESRCVRDFWSRDKGLACVEFSADGAFVLAGGNDQVIYKYSTESGELVEVLEGHKQLVRSLYLDGVNGRVVSGSYDLDLRCWNFDGEARSGSRDGNAAPGPEMWCLERWSSSWVLSAKGDYRRLVSTSQDGRALVIDFGVGIPGVSLLEG